MPNDDSPPVIQQVLQENKGLQNVYKPGSVGLSFATPDRLKQLASVGQESNQLEYWPPDEPGDKNFPRPIGYDNQHVLETYSTACLRTPILRLCVRSLVAATQVLLKTLTSTWPRRVAIAPITSTTCIFVVGYLPMITTSFGNLSNKMVISILLNKWSCLLECNTT